MLFQGTVPHSMTQHPDHIQRYVRWHGQAMAELERQFNRLIDLLRKANFNPAHSASRRVVPAAANGPTERLANPLMG